VIMVKLPALPVPIVSANKPLPNSTSAERPILALIQSLTVILPRRAIVATLPVLQPNQECRSGNCQVSSITCLSRLCRQRLAMDASGECNNLPDSEGIDR
jgi:hypothetical protein